MFNLCAIRFADIGKRLLVDLKKYSEKKWLIIFIGLNIQLFMSIYTI